MQEKRSRVSGTRGLLGPPEEDATIVSGTGGVE